MTNEQFMQFNESFHKQLQKIQNSFASQDYYRTLTELETLTTWLQCKSKQANPFEYSPYVPKEKKEELDNKGEEDIGKDETNSKEETN